MVELEHFQKAGNTSLPAKVLEISEIGMRIEQNNLKNHSMKITKYAERKSRDPCPH